MKLERNRQRDTHWSWRHGVMLLVGIGLGMWAQHALDRPQSPASAQRPAVSSSGIPPWGRLGHLDFSIELSDEFLPQVSPSLRDPKWFFAGYTPGQLTNLFASCALPEAEATALFQRSSWQVASNGIWLSPPPSAVLNLSKPARQRIYAVLAASELNRSQRFPFRFRPEDFDEWFAGSDLSTDKIALVHRLA